MSVSAANMDQSIEEIMVGVDEITRGRPTAAVLYALAAYIGEIEARSRNPNTERLISIVTGTIREHALNPRVPPLPADEPHGSE